MASFSHDNDVDDDGDAAYEADMRRLEEEDLSPEGISRQDEAQINRQHEFRRAADIVVEVWRQFPDVQAISVFGSVARSLWKEVPRFQPYRRERIKLWHECSDLDLAVWVAGLGNLGALRKAKDRALLLAQRTEPSFGVANHQVDAFLLEPASDRYLGRLCYFNTCPKGNRDCLAEGCGAHPFLKQHDGFRLYADALTSERSFRLFERDSGLLRRAVELETGTGLV